jgi:hypothetical protein
MEENVRMLDKAYASIAQPGAQRRSAMGQKSASVCPSAGSCSFLRSQWLGAAKAADRAQQKLTVMSVGSKEDSSWHNWILHK